MDDSKRLRAGLIGAGHICEYHIAALRRLPQAEIAGIFDLDAKRAEETGKKLDVPRFGSLEELLGSGIDVAHILTPPSSHAKLAFACLDGGCHVLIEKPAAEDADECLRIQARADELGLFACVDHSLLYDPQVAGAFEAIRAGKLGKLVSVDILRGSMYPTFTGGPLPPPYRTAGYPFRDLGIHALYLLEAFLGPIERVQGEWASLGGDPNLAFDEWRAQVRCRDGIGQFQLSWNAKPMQSQIILHGTKAIVRLDLFSMFQSSRNAAGLPKPVERLANVYTDSLPSMIQTPANLVRFVLGKRRQYHGLQELVIDFYQALLEGRPIPSPVGAASSVVRWTEEIARAAESDYAERLARVTARPAEAVAAPILVTGASGGLGGAVVRRLLERGDRVRVFVRRLPESVPDNVEVAVGDLGDPDAVSRAVKGASQVVHAGAAMKGDWTEHERASVRGTANVLAACKEHGVEKLVYVSSLSVIDWAGAPEGAPVSEATPYEPHADRRGFYTQAKLEAERLVAAETELSTVILRPGQIFGGSIPLITPAVARRAGGGWLILGDGKLPLPLVYLDDVVDAALLALDKTLKPGLIVQLVDPAVKTQEQVLWQVYGREAKIWRVARPVVFGLGKLSEILLKPLGRQSPLAAYRLKSALARRTFESSQSATTLGWTPRVGIDHGIDIVKQKTER